MGLLGGQSPTPSSSAAEGAWDEDLSTHSWGKHFLESGIWFSEILALLDSKNVLNTFATLIKICVSVCLGQKRIKVKV